MSPSRKRKPTTFRQRDVSRALRAARAVGLPVSGFEISKDGSISIKTGTAGEQQRSNNPWDTVLTDAEDTKRPA
jgi:hypothetical protein